MLQYWVRRTSPLPSWSALIRALHSSVIKRGDIVRAIEALPVRIKLFNVTSEHVHVFISSVVGSD